MSEELEIHSLGDVNLLLYWAIGYIEIGPGYFPGYGAKFEELTRKSLVIFRSEVLSGTRDPEELSIVCAQFAHAYTVWTSALNIYRDQFESQASVHTDEYINTVLMYQMSNPTKSGGADVYTPYIMARVLGKELGPVSVDCRVDRAICTRFARHLDTSERGIPFIRVVFPEFPGFKGFTETLTPCLVAWQVSVIMSARACGCKCAVSRLDLYMFQILTRFLVLVGPTGLMAPAPAAAGH